MTIYFLAPLTLLEYCDKIQAEAHASLPDILEDGVLVARPDGPNMDRDRLRKLDERKLRAAHAIWGMSRNPIWHRIVSFWWLFTTLRLFYDYYVMLQDLKRLRHRSAIDVDAAELPIISIVIADSPQVTAQAAEATTAAVAGCSRGNVDGED